MNRVRFDPRFEGPPGVVNGGVVASMFGGVWGGDTTLRRPVPLDTDLRVLEEGAGDDRVLRLVVDGADETLVEGRSVGREARAGLTATAQRFPTVDLDAARAASASTPLADEHPFPRCYGCGPEHPAGVHSLAGQTQDGAWAAAFTIREPDLRSLYAALDCTSSAPHAVDAAPGTALVLGRLVVAVLERPSVGDDFVALAKDTGAEGRRHFSVSAVFGADGRAIAVANATWVTVAADWSL